ncbi:sterol desaturase family protein [Bradyrhizobium sp. 138]|uniref:sterol desaturase family protein n=1 Tax=Bradyrhizobium sp. 138 TaxID=2782615 RepID=UPI001FF8ACC4|nr:sterol desaturase family protein [Bradyrhizobium sp. 138]
MNDTLYGTRDKRGYWKPSNWPLLLSIHTQPTRPQVWLRYLFGFPGYLWPWSTVYFLITLGVWYYLTPPLEMMRQFSVGWISFILARNAGLVLLVYGTFHALLYIQRRQGTDFKYNIKWPDIGNPTFLFGNQTAENVFWTMCSGVPVLTAYEVLTWWLFANEYVPYVSFAEHPIYFFAVLVLIPLWREAHFYFIHRLIHLGPLYNIIHKVHHNNVNPGPWSGLSMHTFEHVIYFTNVLIHFVVPSHPLHAIYELMNAALSPAKTHVGFHKLVVVGEQAIPSDNYFHYLHHKLFEVNYSDRSIPFDVWFGTAHDGSPEADEQLFKRLRASKANKHISAPSPSP